MSGDLSELELRRAVFLTLLSSPEAPENHPVVASFCSTLWYTVLPGIGLKPWLTQRVQTIFCNLNLRDRDLPVLSILHLGSSKFLATSIVMVALITHI